MMIVWFGVWFGVSLLGFGVLAVCAVVALHLGVALFSHVRRLSYLRHTLRETELVPARERAWSLLHELACMHRLTWWELRSLLPRRRRKRQGRPVVLVHGALGARAPHLFGVRKALERGGRHSYLVDLHGMFAGPEAKAPRLRLALERAVQTSHDGVDIVTHSMGAIVLRLVLDQDPSLAREVRSVVCLGAPHRGTAFARGMRCVPEARALHRHSRLLRELPDLSALAPQAQITTIAAREDFIVYPPETTTDPRARAIVLDGLGHAGLLVSRRALRATRHSLRAA